MAENVACSSASQEHDALSFGGLLDHIDLVLDLQNQHFPESHSCRPAPSPNSAEKMWVFIYREAFLLLLETLTGSVTCGLSLWKLAEAQASRSSQTWAKLSGTFPCSPFYCSPKWSGVGLGGDIEELLTAGWRKSDGLGKVIGCWLSHLSILDYAGKC